MAAICRKMKLLLVAALILRSGGAAGVPLHAQNRRVAAEPRIRVLVVSGGPFHDYVLQSKLLMEALGKALPIDWTVIVEGAATNSRVALYNTPNWASGFDVVVHNECYADVADETFIRKITAPHRGGVPAIVIHCAMHSYRDAKVDDWREFLGVSTRRHTQQHRIAVKVIDAAHPTMQGWKSNWVTPTDELYVIDKLWPTARALATAVSPEDKTEYPLVWVNDYGGTRVFGTTLGHSNETWSDPVFQDLLVRGLKWTLENKVRPSSSRMKD